MHLNLGFDDDRDQDVLGHFLTPLFSKKKKSSVTLQNLFLFGINSVLFRERTFFMVTYKFFCCALYKGIYGIKHTHTPKAEQKVKQTVAI